VKCVVFLVDLYFIIIIIKKEYSYGGTVAYAARSP